MSTPPDRRSRKRLATRQSISDVATQLFWQRGFDQVTVDQIADAADVGRMTVFNHFPRKEDLFFDREEEGSEAIRKAVRQRDTAVGLGESLRLLIHRLVAEHSPYLSFTEGGQNFVQTIAGSDTLKARARAIRDELAQVVAVALSEAAGREPSDPDAQLAGHLLLATWATAFIHAHQVYQQGQDADKATNRFLALVDQGSRGLQAAMAGTPYA